MSGDDSGTSSRLKRVFLYCFGIAAVIVGVVNTVNVITITHDQPSAGLLGPIIWEGSSWITFLAFFWIPWIAWRIAPPLVRPRSILLIHFVAAPAFSFAHVAGFIALRKLAYWLAHSHYAYGLTLGHFSYELGKDALGYTLLLAVFTLVDHLLQQQQPRSGVQHATATFDIRDGAKLTRVRLDDVLAIASAANYVEFVMGDGRRLLMRSSLQSMEEELGPRRFVRTHRSWLVNAAKVTALKPEGSGDYAVELDKLTVPLSRRYGAALAKLRG